MGRSESVEIILIGRNEGGSQGSLLEVLNILRSEGLRLGRHLRSFSMRGLGLFFIILRRNVGFFF